MDRRTHLRMQSKALRKGQGHTDVAGLSCRYREGPSSRGVGRAEASLRIARMAATRLKQRAPVERFPLLSVCLAATQRCIENRQLEPSTEGFIAEEV